MTDEYSQRASSYGDPSALNWVDLLAQLRGPAGPIPELTFGGYQTNSNTWGSPRYRGYDNNWALGGANTATLLSQGQHSGVATQVREALVQYVAIFIGSNDFNPYAHDAYRAIYADIMPFLGAGDRQYADPNEYVDSIVARYTTALDTVSDAGANIVMATIADFGVTPRVIGDFPNVQNRQRVTDVIKTVNNRLKSLAAARALPIVDIFGLANLYLGSDPLTIGGIAITRGAPPSANSQYLILPDRVHPGTVWQGLLANAFIEACNRSYGTNFTPLSDQEILASAGISISEEDVTFFDIRPFAITRYSGGSGVADDPYQIATAEGLILLGDSPEDYDKHFVMTADIDLDPNLPGGKVFDKAVVQYFSGVFVGNGHVISHLRVLGGSYLGLFGQLSGKVRSFGLAEVSIHGSGDYVGALAGTNYGDVTQCYSTGAISGNNRVGGLVGSNETEGSLANCWSMGLVRGVCWYPMSWYLGNGVGGLAGANWGTIESCYSAAATSGNHQYVGGLVGENVHYGMIDGSEVNGHVDACFWDTETSSQVASNSGIGRTTFEMQTAHTFLEVGWDFLGEIENGLHEVWKMPEGGGYPVLAIFNGYTPPVLQGLGTVDSPYIITDAAELGAIIHHNASAHYRLDASIDMAGIHWPTAVIPIFAGTFDGNSHSISHLTISGGSYVGMFGQLESGAEIRSLGVVDVNIAGSYEYAGGLAAYSEYSTVTQCYSAGIVRGGDYVGGLMGWNGSGEVRYSYSTATVIGNDFVAGLVGVNSSLLGPGARITQCYSAGLVGSSDTGPWRRGEEPSVSGLVSPHNDHYSGSVNACFWDIQTSGQVTSDGGVGLTTVEMQMAATFLDSGWDFVDETTNGTEDIWKIVEGQTYPLLSWEKYSGGTGEPNDPYQIATAADLIALGETPEDYDKHFILTADIDLDPNLPGRKVFDKAVIAPDSDPCDFDWLGEQLFTGTSFTGFFDGSGHVIQHLTIRGDSYLGLFGRLVFGSDVKDLGVDDVDIVGSGDHVGGLVGYNYGALVTQCYSSGVVSGISNVGGLVGVERRYIRTIVDSYSTATVIAIVQNAGGLVGYIIEGTVVRCYSTGRVAAPSNAGGLVGKAEYSKWGSTVVTACFWDAENSGQTTSAGGLGKTTAEMHDPNTFMAAGWDLVDQLDGPHNIWTEPEGSGYPILWWQQAPLPELPIFSGGNGEPNDPYRISTPSDLNSIGYNPRLMGAHFELVNDIDLRGISFYVIGSEFYPFTGSFNGNGREISHMAITGGRCLGLFAWVEGKINNLGIVDANIVGSGSVGALAGLNDGTVTQCYSTGFVSGTGGYVGGLAGRGDNLLQCYSTSAVIGDNRVGGLVGAGGNLQRCYSTGAVTGNDDVGGLVGLCWGTVTQCFCSGVVTGEDRVGGLVGDNVYGDVTQSYSTGAVTGTSSAGGLVGHTYAYVTQCFSTGDVSGRWEVGGLVGSGDANDVIASFWDTQTSGRATSAGGTGKTTAQMKRASTFLEAGWDFVDETANGTEDIWWILEVQDYPRLWWEIAIDY